MNSRVLRTAFARALRPVVRSEDHERVVRQFLLVEFLHQHAERVIQWRDVAVMLADAGVVDVLVQSHELGIGFDGQVRFMRPDGDYTPDEVLKRGWLESRPKILERVFLVIDDRQKVVDMWREMGLTCFQVAPGKF